MQAIKALVFAMAILLVAGIALLGYGLYSKSRKLTGEPAPVAAAPPAGVAFGELSVPLAPGAEVEDMETVAGRLAVRVREGEAVRIIVLDPLTGSVSGTFALRPQGAAADRPPGAR